MFFKHEKIENNDLRRALDACKYANKQGYKDAKVYLDELKKSIEKASDIISECVDGMQTYHITDTDLINNVRHQLETVQTEFEKSYFDTKKNLEIKNKQSAKFNITLFGRTKAGKSTLMEILTHGDGSHMGKGGQRTTRDVRSYDWNGMSVTDIPGIDAYDGEDDDTLAEEAAVYADLILFMITAGQPESTEADWLVKLKKMDKPIICVCNFKQSIGESLDDLRLKRLLGNPERLKERMNIDEMVKQFNQFINEQLPNEHVEFFVTHLLAKFASQRPEYKEISEGLAKVSRFENIENAIIQEVYRHGVLHRKKSYLSIIDSPLYLQMNQLFQFSAAAYSQFRIIQDKAQAFQYWCDEFNKNEKEKLHQAIVRQFNQLRNSIPGFAEDHVEDDDVSGEWSRHCNNYNIKKNIDIAISATQKRLKEKLSELFAELNQEMQINLTYNLNKELGNYKFFNWKKATNWAGVLGSAGLGIAAFVLGSNPLTLAAFGVAAVFSIFSWLCDSREDKLRERRQKLSDKIRKSIDKDERKALNTIDNWFENSINTAEKNVIKRLVILEKSLLSLSCGERELALGYSENHRTITKRIVDNILDSMSISEREKARVKFAVRVPGRRLTLVVEGKERLNIKLADLAFRLGSKETINIINLDFDKPRYAQIYFLFRYFGFDRPRIKEVNNNTQTVAYLSNDNFTEEQFDSLSIIQQIMKIHIIIR